MTSTTHDDSSPGISPRKEAVTPVGDGADAGCVNLATLGEESFAWGTAVMMESALRCCSAQRRRVIIVDLQTTPGTQRKLVETGKALGAEVEFLRPEESEVFRETKKILRSRRRSFLTQCWFAKLAVPDLLAGRMDHVFCIDSDVVCGLDLMEAQRVLRRGQPVCAVADGPMTKAGYSVEFEIERLEGTAPYFNTGVMGLDLNFWKAQDFSPKALALAEKFTRWPGAPRPELSARAAAVVADHGLMFSDQAVFNILYYRNWKSLEPDWNVQSPYGYGLLQEMAQGRKMNLHAVTNPKPWQAPVDERSAYFFECLDRTAYRGKRPNALYWRAHLMLRTWKYRVHRALTRGGSA